MDTDDYFQKEAEKIIPKQSHHDTRNFWERNKKIILISAVCLAVLYLFVMIYVHVELQYLYQHLSRTRK